MSKNNRRLFVQQSSLGVTAFMAAGGISSPLRGAQQAKLKIGLIGCGGRGTNVAETFLRIKNVELGYVCDPDASRLEAALEKFGKHVKASGDLREVLEDETIEAVIVATPDHWHAPAAILACDAGKHVYVEKPCSHNVREGRLLVDAARRNRCVVQHGTQVRSTAMMIEAVELLRSGIIGDVLVSKAWNIQRRGNIGHGKPTDPPKGFDYDTWVGPATMIPYQANRVHGGWHWWYHFGTGDMGNDGVHDVEYARWGLGVETHPKTITAVGGKYFFDDNQQFPDTQQVAFEYPGNGAVGNKRMLIYEQRLWSTNYPHNVDSGVEFYGTQGQMFLSRRGKIAVFGDRNQRIQVQIDQQPQDTDAHVANFVDCVRTGERPNADIELGHMTTTLCHLGNIATQLTTQLEFDGEKEQITNNERADRLLLREYRPEHWGTPHDENRKV